MCFYCWETGIPLKACARCNLATYCNEKCQKKHWPLHKKKCDELKEIKLEKSKEKKSTGDY